MSSHDLVLLAVVLNCSQCLDVGSLVEDSQVRDDYMHDFSAPLVLQNHSTAAVFFSCVAAVAGLASSV